ncbi:MAG: inositol monophosphatase family protein, partial [Dictyoglomus sp.]
MDKYLEIGQKAVKKAGDILLSYISKDKNVTLKSISNLVTDVDRISEKTIINIIEENFPDYS